MCTVENSVRYITLPLEEYEAMVKEIEELKKRKDAPMPEIDDITFLSSRLYSYLTRQGIRNIKDIEETTPYDWQRLPGFGRKTWSELKNLMKLYGVHFKDK